MTDAPDRPTNAALLKESPLELLLLEQIEQAGLLRPYWQRKIDNHKCDFTWCAPAYPGLQLIVEVQGGTRGLGRHSREPGYGEDRMRSNFYQLNGWKVLEFTSAHVNGEVALWVIRRALEGHQ